jgi:ATP-dependent DNA helicase 2 subunit 2
LKSLADQCKESAFGTAAEAVEDALIPRVKQSRPYKTYTGQLALGDPEKYVTAMSIDVERYFRTHKAVPASASSFVIRSRLSNGEASSSNVDDDVTMGGTSGPEGGLTAVKTARTYKVNDESAPGGKRDVDRDELARGYEYGRTAVHIAESDENVTKLETMQSFIIIGFIPCEKVYRTPLSFSGQVVNHGIV